MKELESFDVDLLKYERNYENKYIRQKQKIIQQARGELCDVM